MATLPSTTLREGIPTIGFIAHMDTSPDMTGKDVKPRIVTYDGGTIVLNEAEQIVLSRHRRQSSYNRPIAELKGSYYPQ